MQLDYKNNNSFDFRATVTFPTLCNDFHTINSLIKMEHTLTKNKHAVEINIKPSIKKRMYVAL